MDTNERFEKEWKKIDKLIKTVKAKTADMDKATFLSAMGTVMKLYSYSIEHDIPMKDFIIEFMLGIFSVEKAVFDPDFDSEIPDGDDAD